MSAIRFLVALVVVVVVGAVAGVALGWWAPAVVGVAAGLGFRAYRRSHA
jgi:hypothetical protein